MRFQLHLGRVNMLKYMKGGAKEMARVRCAPTKSVSMLVLEHGTEVMAVKLQQTGRRFKYINCTAAFRRIQRSSFIISRTVRPILVRSLPIKCREYWRNTIKFTSKYLKNTVIIMAYFSKTARNMIALSDVSVVTQPIDQYSSRESENG